ncbi:DUF3231 family protein [Paenibacillus hamazuiensis]|uniref:DUF3231 family protein n=1 Tax=Paenibacillus hamazuiensis TaxID=2936508 RepID=UPI00200E3967|nr:DUF3231 family protein [Paenibacillus hamazuiensis]
MNWFEVIKDAIEPFLDGEKQPLHVGEVMNLWYYLAGTQHAMRGEQVALNTVKNEELKKHFQDLQKIHKSVRDDIIALFQKEGIPQPRVTPPKNQAVFANIPDDAKFSDEEAAQLVSENLVLAITFAARGITEAGRSDVAAMFAKFMSLKTAFAITFKDFLKRQGWLILPPAYHSELIGSK